MLSAVFSALGGIFSFLGRIAPDQLKSLWCRVFFEARNRDWDARYGELYSRVQSLIESGDKESARKLLADEAARLLQKSSDRPEKFIPRRAPDDPTRTVRKVENEAMSALSGALSGGRKVYDTYGVAKDQSVYALLSGMKRMEYESTGFVVGDIRLRTEWASPEAGAEKYESHPTRFRLARFLIGLVDSRGVFYYH